MMIDNYVYLLKTFYLILPGYVKISAYAKEGRKKKSKYGETSNLPFGAILHLHLARTSKKLPHLLEPQSQVGTGKTGHVPTYPPRCITLLSQP